MLRYYTDYIWMDGDVRLVEGSNSVDRYEGRLEIYHDNRWGTVCAKNTWGMSEATVVCQQLGRRRDHVEVTRHFGPARDAQEIFLDEVHCSGLESTLAECQSPGWGVHDDDCTHEDDIGVVCGSGEE